MKPSELAGRVFGKLLVLKRNGSQYASHACWDCLCECGKITQKTATNLITGNSKSCGCMQGFPKRDMNYLYSFQKWLIARYIRSAKVRKLEFALSFSDFFSIVVKKCAYCGFEGKNMADQWRSDKTSRSQSQRKSPKRLDPRSLEVNFIANGIDRIDNNKGYTLDNSISCCLTCNMMKLNHSKDEFIEHIKKIAKNFGESNDSLTKN